MEGGEPFEAAARPSGFDYLHDRDLIRVEKAFLRNRPGRAAHERYLGLALSGGGMRSASFALGVLQALARCDRLKEIDYLSTVSGGGYIGSSLTWLLHRPWRFSREKPEVSFGVGPDDFPFGIATDPTRQPGMESREKRSLLRHLRQNLNYLFPGDGIGPTALLTAMVRGIALNILVYGPILVLGLFLLAFFGQFLPFGTPCSHPFMYLERWLCVAGVIALAVVVSAPLYGLVTHFVRSHPTTVYKIHRGYLRVASYLLLISGLLALVGLLPELSQWGWQGASSLTVAGFLSSLWAHLRTFNAKVLPRRVPTTLIVGVAAALLVVGILILGYVAADWLVGLVIDAAGPAEAQRAWQWVLVISLLAFLASISGILTNINLVTLHRYYRDRLMELFMPEPSEATIDKPAKPATLADGTELHTMCNYLNKIKGPYHIINTNVLLCGSRVTKFRGRGGDSFILSPLYCGSNATGWVRTDKFMDGKFTLATSMAVSGAAISAHAGAAGEGVARNPWLAALIAIFNIRLGVWVDNPLRIKERASADAEAGSARLPNLWDPGIREILFKNTLNEQADFVELTDGGHFENLGVYELIRRELDVIIACEGVADRDSRFADFSNLVEKVRLDFNATIEIDLDPLIPKESVDRPYGIKDWARQSHAVGSITYASGKKALLVYLGTTLVPDLPVDLYGYKLAHNDYPDETTTDQFFDEKQFEAYRVLGNSLCDRMIKAFETEYPDIWPQSVTTFGKEF